MESIDTIIQTYQNLLQETEGELHHTRQKIRNISMLRLLLFVGAIAAVVFFWSAGWSKILLFAGVPFVVFLLLVKHHSRLFRQKEYLEKKIEINRQELKGLDYDTSDFDGGKEYVDASHLYTFDLDIFGEHSLFQTVNRTSTPMGKEKLARWFNIHLDKKEEIEQRQEAIKELANDLKFRQRFRILGLLYNKKSADESEINDWAKSPSYYRKNKLLSLVPYAVLLTNLICIALALAGILSTGTAGGVFVAFVLLSSIFSKGITKTQAMYGQKLQVLATYADQIVTLEKKEMNSPILCKLQQALYHSPDKTQNRLGAAKEKAENRRETITASQAVNHLAALMNALDQRNNLLISTLLNGLMFWELHQIIRIESWKEEFANDLPRWLKVIGEIDAYCSLATFAYNHPDYIYPEIVSTPFRIKAKALGHPLMNKNKCIRNDVDMEKRPFFIIVTGANMAGKSTYLRTVGINYLLACVGLPVWADEMELYPAHLVTSLRTSDSLTDNESYFFAELKRLKMIINKLEAGEELFIILDEILKGTNSIDKQKGSLALVKQFMLLKANGIIATHDLLLGSLATTFPENIRNYCFEADIKNEELSFSYKMREGIAQNMNACFLMKKMGIAVIDDTAATS